MFYYRFDYETRPESEVIWEAHRKNYDLHIVVEGVEKIYLSHITEMKAINEYDAIKENQLFEGEAAEMIKLKKGFFVLFEPRDVHKTGVNSDIGIASVKKII